MPTDNQLPQGAIGHIDDLSAEERVGKHVDGLTGYVFSTEEDYLNHVSPVTGHKPTEPEHLGEEFRAVSEAALQRGAERAEQDGPMPSQAPDNLPPTT